MYPKQTHTHTDMTEEKVAKENELTCPLQATRYERRGKKRKSTSSNIKHSTYGLPGCWGGKTKAQE